MAESSNVSSQESFSNYRNSDRGDQEQQQQQQQRQFQPHQQNVNERDRPTEIPAAKVSRTLAKPDVFGGSYGSNDPGLCGIGVILTRTKCFFRFQNAMLVLFRIISGMGV